MARDIIKIKGLKKLLVGFRNMASFEGSDLLMEDLGNSARKLILDRTARGIDVDGDNFDPYSKSYNRLRSKKGLPVDDVDLFFTGSMLSAMTYESDKMETKLFFASTPDKTGVMNDAKAYYNNEEREFFALSARDVEKLTKEAQEYVSELIKMK